MDIKITTGIKITGLDPNEKVSHKGKLQGGELFVITEPNGDYSKSRVFFKKARKKIEEVKVISVQKYRDGGTTEIETERGKFYFPTPLKPQQRPSFSEANNNIQEIFS
jgi:hypothetical protein